jgi:hypothetical protein
MIKLPLWLQVYLRDKPEYGMGYQYGIATLDSGSKETGYILNASTFAKSDELKGMSPKQVAEVEGAAHRSAYAIKDFDLIPRSLTSLRGVRKIRVLTAKAAFSNEATIQAEAVSGVLRASHAAKDAPITVTVVTEEFRRFSAYENDFRITAKRALTAGTFATTAEDAENVRTGREAVQRYALENKQSANKRFPIVPPKDTSVQRGIVEPAYGEPGGGVEVIFVNGTPDGTVGQPDMLPEE